MTSSNIMRRSRAIVTAVGLAVVGTVFGLRAVRNRAVPLTSIELTRFSAGRAVYGDLCSRCHMEQGRGQPHVAPSLVDSRYVLDPDAGATIRVVLAGKDGKIGVMPQLGFLLDDEQIASVLTYIRRAWGHTAPAVEPAAVHEIRALTRDHTKPWTDAELVARGR